MLKRLVIEPYDPGWADEFAFLSDVLRRAGMEEMEIREIKDSNQSPANQV